MNRNGFSLIEIMISIAILAMISLMVVQTTTRSFQLKEDLGSEGEFNNSIKLAMNVVERDVSQVFTPLMMMPKSKADAAPMAAVPNPAPFWGGMMNPSGLRSSRFHGSERKMSFVTAAHERVYKDAKESFFEKVTYSIEADPKPDPGLEGTLALFRTTNTNVFDVDGDDRKTDKTYKLLSGIKSAQFKFFQRGKDVWQRSWDTESNEFKNHFPDAVEIMIDITGKRQLSYQGRFLYRLEAPIHGLFPST